VGAKARRLELCCVIHGGNLPLPSIRAQPESTASAP